MAADADLIKTDLLIVGAGPAGASLACFLAEHGKSTRDAFRTVELEFSIIYELLVTGKLDNG